MMPARTHVSHACRHTDSTSIMARFKGQAEYSVDAKGRVAIPAKMRAALSPDAQQTFTLTKGFEKCMYLYPLDEWRIQEDKLARLNSYDRESRLLVRMMLMWAEEITLDGQGRVSIPRTLSDYAGLGDRALIIGAIDRIEIWDPVVFEDYLNEAATNPEELAERVMGSGL